MNRRIDLILILSLLFFGFNIEIKPQNDTTNHSKNDNNSMSTTVFLSAAEHGNLELIKSYVEAGFPIDTLSIYKNTTTQIRSTALHLACQENQYEIVKYLLANHANPNIKDFFDLVPLFYAIKGCPDKNIVELLIKHGANINTYMSGGISPLFLARALKKNNIADILINNGADTLPEYKKRVEIVKELLRYISIIAQQYYRKPELLGGGGNSFIGFTLPEEISRMKFGEYNLDIKTNHILLSWRSDNDFIYKKNKVIKLLIKPVK